MRSERRWLHLAGGAALVVAVLCWTGTEPVVAGLASLDGSTLALGAVLAVPTTVAGAWRWQLVAGRLGVGLDLRTAIAACYSSQFLNATMPGGVLGDVHRGLRHGRAAGSTAGTTVLALRAVVWERMAGQVVQAALALAGLALLPSPVRGLLLGPVGVFALVAAAAGATVLVRRTARTVGAARVTWTSRALRSVRTDLERVVTTGTVVRVVLASTVAVTGYTTVYLLAARAVGVTTPLAQLLPLVLLVLVAAGLPFNVAGWGPREGMAAWSFAAAGLGAAQGVAAAVAYGALVLVGVLPGAVVLALSTRARRSRPVEATPTPSLPTLGTGAARG